MQVRISAIKAYLSREMDVMDDNVNSIITQDPFVVLTLGNQTQRTKTKMNQKVPIWDEEFVFKSEGNNVLDVKVMDEDQLVNEEIGSCQIDLRPLLQDQKSIEKYFQLRFGNIAAGKILLRFQFGGGQIQNKNTQNVKSYGEMKWYTPTEESIVQYALHLKNIENLGSMIGLQKAQKQEQFLQTQQKVLQSFPQQQNNNYQANQSAQRLKGNFPQTAYQSMSPQITPQLQLQSASRLRQVEVPQPYQQNNFVLNQPNSRLRYAQSTNQTGLTVTQRFNERRPVLNEQNYSYAPQPSNYRGSF